MKLEDYDGIEYFGCRVKLLSAPCYKDFLALATKLKGFKEIKYYYLPREIKEIIFGTAGDPNGFSATNLEDLNYTFLIEGISRTCTHQLVRTRLGASYSQESFRIKDIRDNKVKIPLTCQGIYLADGKLEYNGACNFEYRVKQLNNKIKDLYIDMVEAGIPYQDARFIMPMGTTTYIIVTYNYRTLYGLAKRRLCKAVQWEIREVVKGIKKAMIEQPKCNCKMCGEINIKLSELLQPPCGGGSFNCSNDGYLFPSCQVRYGMDSSIYSNDVNLSYILDKMNEEDGDDS